MSDEDELRFDVGDIVWVKLGVQWWPGEVFSGDQVPQEILSSHKKQPIAIVKFFHEDTYEFVKNLNHILPYNNPKKMEFIRKGMDVYRQNNNKYMNKFPSDVETAERIIGGDVNILTRVEFAPIKKLDYSSIFGDQSKKIKKGNKSAQNSKSESIQSHRGRKKKNQSDQTMRRPSGYTLKEFDKNHESRIIPQATIQTSPNASPGTYKCHLCNFTSTRQNVIVLHTKTHAASSTPLISNKPKEPKSILKKKKPSYRVEPLIIIEDSDSGSEEKQKQSSSTEEKSGSNTSNNRRNDESKNTNHSRLARNVDKSRRVSATVTSNRYKSQQEENSNNDDVTVVAVELDDTPPTHAISTSVSVTTTSSEKKKKSEIRNEIRSKLLADWSDDDDGENVKEILLDKKEKDFTRAPTRLEMPIRLSSDHLGTGIQEKDELIDFVKQSDLSDAIKHHVTTTITTMTTSSSSSSSSVTSSTSMVLTSTPKYRNIPKKDRRDVVLKDFNNPLSPSKSSVSNADKLLSNSDSLNSTVTEKSKVNDDMNEISVSISEKENKSDKLEIDEGINSEIPLKDDKDIISSGSESKLTEDAIQDVNTITASTEKNDDTEEVNENVCTEKINDDENIIINNEKNAEKKVEDLDENDSDLKDDSQTSETKRKSLENLDDKQKEIQQQQQQTQSISNDVGTNKSSISCFDFREDEDEEEDFLSSLSKLKKKYLSPEKNRDHVNDDGKQEHEQQQQNLSENEIKEKLELEKRDKKLSEDIEKLLSLTKFSETVVDNIVPCSSGVVQQQQQQQQHQEVRTLPPKERGKRIFKSRNRSKYEETSTTASIANLFSSLPTTLNTKHNNMEQQQQQEKPKDSYAQSDLNKNKTTDESDEELKTNFNNKPVNVVQNLKDQEMSIENQSTEVVNEGIKSVEDNGVLSKPQNLEENVVCTENTKNTILNVTVEITESIEKNSDNKNNDSSKSSNENVELNKISQTIEKYPDDIVNEFGEKRNENRILIKDNEESDINYRNELAVAETLISIPSKLNEMEFRKIEQQTHVFQLQQGEQKENIVFDDDDDNCGEKEIENNKEVNKNKEKEEVITKVARDATPTKVNCDGKNNASENVEQQEETVKGKPISSNPPQRKRRSHMKITPRKRIIQESSSSSSSSLSDLIAVIQQKDQDQMTTAKENPCVSSQLLDQEIIKQQQNKIELIQENQQKETVEISKISSGSEQKNKRSNTELRKSIEQQSSSEDNFVKKYIKDAMLFDVNDSAQQLQQKDNMVGENVEIFEAKSEEEELVEKPSETENNGQIKEDKEIVDLSESQTSKMKEQKSKVEKEHLESAKLTVKMTMVDVEKPAENENRVDKMEESDKSSETEIAGTIISINEQEITDSSLPSDKNKNKSEKIKIVSETRNQRTRKSIENVEVKVTGEQLTSSLENTVVVEAIKETFENDHVTDKILDNEECKMKLQLSSPTKDVLSLRSFRPRKAKENIDARIRASLSPPTDDFTMTKRKSPISSSSNSNQQLQLEIKSYQKSSSSENLTKVPKFDLECQQKEDNDNVENKSDDKRQKQIDSLATTCHTIHNRKKSSDIMEQKTIENVIEEVATGISSSNADNVTMSETEINKNLEKSNKLQRSLSTVIVDKLTDVQKSKVKSANEINNIISKTNTNVKQSQNKEVCSKNEVVIKSPTKLQKEKSIEIVQQKTISSIKNVQEKSRQLHTQQITSKKTSDIETTGAITITATTTTTTATTTNKHDISTTNVINDNKLDIAVRVPKKRKPAFDDIEDIPSFIIQKRPALTLTSSSAPTDRHQQQKIEKPTTATVMATVKSDETAVSTKQQQQKSVNHQQQQQQQQQQQNIICKTLDEATMFDINNLPILLTNESMLHGSGDGNVNQVHIVITPHSNSPSTATIVAVTENMPLSSSPLSTAITTTAGPSSSKNTSLAKKKVLKQQLNVASNQVISVENSNQKSIKPSKSSSKVLIQDEPKQIGVDGKGNKFVIVRSENGAKMIIQPDTSLKSKRKDIPAAAAVLQSSNLSSPTSTMTSQRKGKSPTSITTTTATTTILQHQSVSLSNQPTSPTSTNQNSLSNKNIGTPSEKANIISSQIISPIAGKRILSKTCSGSPPISVGSDSNVVITSKGNVYTSKNKQMTTFTTTMSTSNICNRMDSSISKNLQNNNVSSVASNISTSAAITASSLSRRLSRQGTTIQPLSGNSDRIARQQQGTTVVDETPKIIIQPKTIDEICINSPLSSQSQQKMQQHSSQPQQLEPGEISASEAAELTSRFGFIEVVQQDQSPSPPQVSDSMTTTTIITNQKKSEPAASTKYVQQQQQQHQQQQQQHKISRRIKNKVEDTSVTVNKFSVTEVPPLAALSGSNDNQKILQQQQQQQITSRSAVKRKSAMSTSQITQQNVQTVSKPMTKQPMQTKQAVQFSESESTAISTSTSTVPLTEKAVLNSTSSATTSASSSNLSKKINDNQKLLAVPGESFGGPPGSFYLCTSEKEGYVPVDNIPLFLDANNQLIPIQTEPKATIIDDGTIALQDTQVIVETGDSGEQILTDLSQLGDGTNQFILNTEDGQQIILDQQSLLALAANSVGNGPDAPQFITVDGQQLILASDVLTAVNQSNDLTGPILLSETIDGQLTTSNPDILAAALAGSEVYHQDHQLLQIDNGNILQIETSNGVQLVEQGITFQPINPPVTAQTSETNAILTQPPIMSTLEVPSSKKKAKLDPTVVTKTNDTGLIGQNLDDSLAVIGVTTQSSAVPASLNLPITVTNPAIAPKTSTNPITLSGIYPTTSAGLGQGNQVSPTLSSIGNEQELVAAGYELFTSIDTQQTSELVECADDNVVINKKNLVNEIILKQQHQQQTTNDEIVMADFNSSEDATNITDHHQHSNEFVVHNIEHQHQTNNSGNFDNSANNR